jgi:hypothetical protein
VSEKRVLRGIFVTKGEEESGERRISLTYEIHNVGMLITKYY